MKNYTTKHINEHVRFNGLKLNDRQISALEKMSNESVEFTYKSYSELFDVSITTSKRDLNDLVDNELINTKKIKNANYYYI